MGHVSETTIPCKECRRPIRFVKTSAGKWLPVDPAFIESATVGDKVVTKAGVVVTVESADKPLAGFVPHWATCSAPEKFRK